MKPRALALCGLLTAAAEVVLLLGSVIPLATFCAPMLAMLLLLPILEEYGPRTALCAYTACALLGLLLAADRELALVYLFFGWYPVLRPHIAGLRHRWLRVLCRLVICNGGIALLYGLILTVLGIGETQGNSVFLLAVLLLTGSICFLLLDVVLERFTVLWRTKYRRRLFRP